MLDATSQETPILAQEAHEFDFLEGEWDAACRFLRPDGSWGEGPGTLKATKVLDGCLSVELFEGVYQGERIKGLGLRAFNPKLRCWEHTWTDTSSPGGFQVWRGRFTGGKIGLFGEWEDGSGQRSLFRVTWCNIIGARGHWESHRYIHGGGTWK